MNRYNEYKKSAKTIDKNTGKLPVQRDIIFLNNLLVSIYLYIYQVPYHYCPMYYHQVIVYIVVAFVSSCMKYISVHMDLVEFTACVVRQLFKAHIHGSCRL